MFVSDLAIGSGNDSTTRQNKKVAFKRDTIECRFLFDADVATYFDLVHENATALVNAQLGFERPRLSQEEEDAIRTRLTELHTWFFDQSEEMFSVFQNDLSIKTLR